MTKEPNYQELQSKADQFFGESLAADELHGTDSLSHDPLSPAKRAALLQLAELADEPHFRRTVLGALKTLFALVGARSSDSDLQSYDSLPENSLAYWVWDIFLKYPSAVFATLVRRFNRDDFAVIHLAQRLGTNPDFETYPADQPAWSQRLLKGKYQAICLVGRPGLHGQDAVDQLVSKQLRFSFPDSDRPENLSRDDLDPQSYHRIRELISSSPPKYKEHCASEANGRRYDFGLLQRYPIEFGGRKIVVVLCAGTSSLGTLAAADWACSYLWDTVHFENHQPIPRPQTITPESVMEALISVTAPLSNSEHAWKLATVELQTLIVDHSVWCLEDKEWRLGQIRVITIVYEGDKPISVLFDEQPTNQKPNSQNFRLFVTAALLALRDDGRIDEHKLAKKSKSWNNGKQLDAKEVRLGLSSIKNRCNLGDTLTIDSTGIRLHATVVEKKAGLAEGEDGGA